jgi:POT family proton-dependent oligopeptide transporter
MASGWWLVAAYFVLEAGEMRLSPVGLSAVTQLSMPKVVSLMMGTWFLATAFSEALAALFGKLAAIEIPEGEVMNFADAAAKYSHLFWLLMWVGIGCATAAFLAAPLLRKWMHGVKNEWTHRRIVFQITSGTRYRTCPYSWYENCSTI